MHLWHINYTVILLFKIPPCQLFLINEVSGILQMHSQGKFLSAILLTSILIFAQLPTLRSHIFSTKVLLVF